MRTLTCLLFCLVACGKNTEPPPPTSGSPMAQPESGPKAKKPAGGGGAINEQAQQIMQRFEAELASCNP